MWRRCLFTRYGIGPWIGLSRGDAGGRGVRRDHRLSRFPLSASPASISPFSPSPSPSSRGIGFDHLGLRQRVGRPVPAGRAICAQRSVAAARQSDDVLLRDPRRDRAGLRCSAALLLRSRIGYFWLAIREDEQAARAVGIDTFRYKMYAVMISAAVTSFAGVFYAFFYNNLFPEQVFNIARSIEMILGPVIGGIGTLFGPILGAFVLTGLAETLNSVDGACRRSICPAPSRCSTASACCVVIVALPEGVWPWLARAARRQRSDKR